MAHPEVSEQDKMGQGGLCSVAIPQIDSLSPNNSGESQTVTQSATESPTLLDCVNHLLRVGGAAMSNDVLIKLRSVVQENAELKDTINQGNMALRQQMKLLLQWNQQVDRLQLQHRHTSNGLTKKIQSLERENKALKSTLTDFESSNPSPKFCELESLIQSLRTELETSELGLENATAEKEALSVIRKTLEDDVTSLKCDLAARRSELEQLSRQKQSLSDSLRELEERLRQSGGVNANERKPEETVRLERLLLESKRINTSLMQELQDAKRQNEVLKEDASKILTKSRSFTSGYPKGVGNKEGPIEQVVQNGRSPVDDLDEMDRLRSDVHRLKKELSETKGKSEIHQINDHYYHAKIKSIQELHDEATAKIISYEELVATKNEEISRLKRDAGQIKAQLMERKSEGDTIAVLRAQVEVYQGDFRAEREAREAMASDRERLRDEIKHLQMRNSQLIDELDSYQRKLYNYSQGHSSRSGSEEPRDLRDSGNPTATTSGSSQFIRSSVSPDKRVEARREPPVPEIDENLLYCPKCNKSFSELRPLEEHVNICLDED